MPFAPSSDVPYIYGLISPYLSTESVLFHRSIGLRKGELMGGSHRDSLPVCDRCQHFVVRESGLATCAPCRKLWQLQVSIRNILTPKRDEEAVIFVQGCFSLLEEWVAKVNELEEEEEEKAHNHKSAGGRERSPLRRKETTKGELPKSPREAPGHSDSAPSAAPAPAKAPPVQPRSQSQVAPPVEGRPDPCRAST